MALQDCRGFPELKVEIFPIATEALMDLATLYLAAAVAASRTAGPVADAGLRPGRRSTPTVGPARHPAPGPIRLSGRPLDGRAGAPPVPANAPLVRPSRGSAA